MIGFRVDSNEIIATGHFMRCMVIALELQSLGNDVLFICADTNGSNLANRHGFPAIVLQTSWNDMNSEVERLVEVIRVYSIDHLVIDSYQVTYSYLKTMNSIVPVIYIDDLNAFACPVSMIINYNVYANDLTYNAYPPVQTKLLLGPAYVPLRREFQNIKKIPQSEVTSLLISTGGSDPFHIAEELVNTLNSHVDFQNMTLHVVVGPFCKFITHSIGKYNNVVLHRNVANMAELMCISDIAITAGGSTMYEICACGLPAISFSFADNQIPGAEYMDKNGLIPYAGDFRMNASESLLKIVEIAHKLVCDSSKRNEITSKMTKLIDGFGGLRIAQAILSNI